MAVKGKAKSSFADALKGKYAGVWTKARTATASNGNASSSDVIKALNLSDGESVQVVTKVDSARTGCLKDGTPYYCIDFIGIGNKGERGLKFTHWYTIKERGKFTIQMALEIMASELKLLGFKDIAENGEEYVEKTADLLTEQKPSVRLGVKRTGEYVNYRVNKLIIDEGEEEDDDETLEEVSDEEEEIEVEVVAEAEEEEDDDEEDEEEDEEEVMETPEEGDVVMYKAPRARQPEEFKVTVVNSKQDTVTLIRIKDKKRFAGVPFSDVEFIYEEA